MDAIYQILEIDPYDHNALESKIWMEEYVNLGTMSSISKSKQKRDEKIEREMAMHHNPIEHTDPLGYDRYQKLLYEAVCRGDIKSTPKENAPLRCRYQSHKTPFLKIAPLKLEEISLEPLILLYHGVMSDKEIYVITEMAKKIVNSLFYKP